MFAKFIPKNIQQKLKAKERALDWQVSNSVLDSKLKGDIRPRDIASRSIFVRMCSNKSDVDNILISGGEVGPDGEVQFGGNAYKDFSGGDKVRPIAGIKDIQVEYKGGYKALREATINWTIFSLQDLDRLTPYFLTVGKTIALDWGWSYSRKQTINQQLFNDAEGVAPFITKDGNSKFQVNQEIFSNPQETVQRASGDYDAIGGQITNFEYNLREDGGFDCVTKIISLGVSLFQMPIDAGGNSASSVETKGGDQLYVPKDSLINAIISLRNIIVYDVMGVSSTIKGKSGRRSEQYDALSSNKNSSTFQNHCIYDDVTTSAIRKVQVNDDMYGICVDDKKNPNVMWAIQPDGKEDIYVTWGWMEDQLLNRYISFTGGEDNETKLTIRSLDTFLDKDNLPMTREVYVDFIKNFESPDEIFEKYGIIDTDPEYPTRVVKRNTTIKNYPFLYPKQISKFFMLGDNFPVVKSDNTKDGPKTWIWWDDTDEMKRVTNFYDNMRQLGVANTELEAYKRPIFSLFDDKEGPIRNIWVNIKEIQKAFGMSDPTGGTDDNNINPTGTMERALTILLKELNNNFHNAWSFEIVVDPYDPTNLKVIDTNESVKKPKYTKFTEGSKNVDELGIYKFPAFENSSMVKSQNLAFKIPNSMAVTTLYGSNAASKDKINKDNMNHSQLFKLFKGDTGEEANNPFNDKYLKDLESSHVKGLVNQEDAEKDLIPDNVGSQDNDSNSQIRVNQGSLNIDAKASWWQFWTPNSTGENNINKNKDINKKNKPNRKYAIIVGKNGPEIHYVQEQRLDNNGTIENTGNFYKVTPLMLEQDKTTKPAFYSYDEDLGIVLSEDLAYAISSHINADSPSAQFTRDSVLPAELSLEIDGMGGLVPGDLVHTSYIQDKYKSVISVDSEPHGPAFYFQIWGHTQTVSVEGWTTQLETKMRYNSIPDEGKITYEEADAGIGKSVKTKPPNYNLSNANTAALPVDNIIEFDIEGDEDPDDIEDLLDDLNPTPLETAKRVIPTDRLTLREIRETAQVINDGVGDGLNNDPQFQPIVLPDIPDFVVDPNAGFIASQDSDIVVENLKIEPDKPGSSAFKWSLDPNRFALGNSAEEFPLTIPATSEISALPPDIKVKKEIVVQPDIPNATARDMYPTTVGVVPKTQIATTEVPDEAWFDGTVSYGNIEPAPDPIPSVIQPRPEIVILKSTYDGNAGGSRIAARGQTLTDKQQYGDNAYLLSHNYTLMYQLTKWNPNGDKAQIDFYGEGLPTNPNSTRGIKILQKYRQKFWDEVIEAPNETGISEFSIGTPQERLAKMRARRDEIGNTYKSLGPYDTWTPTTGIPIAMYPSYNEQEGGSDIILPQAP
tara:strand:- start:752 stop:4801 length:4050 start_codon:yes stop_codon:yes gene_type:complete